MPSKLSNRLDPDQARYFVGPDLGPTCLQKLSADDTSKRRVNKSVHQFHCESVVSSVSPFIYL